VENHVLVLTESVPRVVSGSIAEEGAEVDPEDTFQLVAVEVGALQVSHSGDMPFGGALRWG